MENNMIRSYFNRANGFVPRLKCVDPSMTEQHHKDACDVNFILDVFQRTGRLPDSVSVPLYEDISDRPDNLLDCMNVVKRANEIFEQVPAQIRARFNNDPVQLLDWISDPNNREEAGNIGLLSKINRAENLDARQSAQNPNLMLNVPTDTNNEKQEK